MHEEYVGFSLLNSISENLGWIKAFPAYKINKQKHKLTFSNASAKSLLKSAEKNTFTLDAWLWVEKFKVRFTKK